MTLTILTVCTGNVCRSPIAELILARGLSSLAEVRVHSAGTGALVGAAVPKPAQDLAIGLGLDASTHRARQIDAQMIREADLIVGMSREHRRIVVESVPNSMRRAFTLRELARVADAADLEVLKTVHASEASSSVDRIRLAIATASSLRGTVAPPWTPEDLDVVDPYNRSDDTYAESFRQLAPAAERIVRFLTAAALR